MSWHSQVESAIIQGDFWQVSQFYQELIEKEPLEISQKKKRKPHGYSSSVKGMKGK